MKKNYLLILLYISLQASGQVGINNKNPNSTLAVNGSLGVKYNQVSQDRYTITSEDFHIAYVGNQPGTITLPSISTGNSSYAGRFYKIKNLSNFDLQIEASDNNTMRISGGNSVVRYIIPQGGFIEAINNRNSNGATWDLGFMGVTPRRGNVSLYSTQLTIPPLTIGDWDNHSNTNYDSGPANNRWWVISKRRQSYEYRLQTNPNSTTNPTYHRTSKMIIVYEFQGPPLAINNLYPILTPGNSSGYPDVFGASFTNIENVNGKTRLTATIARLDLVGNESGTVNGNSSDWMGTFLLNVLLIATTPQ